jgi:type I restriction enzyme S subunit
MKNNKPQKNILSDWPLVKLIDIGSFSKGTGITKTQLVESGVNAIRYGELYTNFDFQIKKIYSFIPEDVLSETKKIKFGDILFAGSGETIDEIGKSAAYLLDEDAYAGGDIIIFTPKNANSLFLSYFLNVGEARKKLRELGQGQSVVHIYKKDIEKIKLHLPPLHEQQRIVAVLETWDQAIEKLSQKIEIKKQIKKALMQNLLTGKKRLPGFSGEWEERKIGKYLKEVVIKTTKNNEYPVLTSSRKGIFLQNDYFDKQVASQDNIGYKIIKNGQFTYRSMTDDDRFVFNRLDKYEVGVVSPAYPVFIPYKIENNYLYYILNTKRFNYDAVQYSQGGTRKSLKLKNLFQVKVNLPTIEEQTAIANILTKSDEELSKLEQKLSLFKDQKKFLLNNLITGKIRTPENLKIK